MMAALQNLSNNSMQAGLRAARYICSPPRLPAVSPLPEALLSITPPLTLFSKASHSEQHWKLICHHLILLYKLSVLVRKI